MKARANYEILSLNNNGTPVPWRTATDFPYEWFRCESLANALEKISVLKKNYRVLEIEMEIEERITWAIMDHANKAISHI